MNQPQHFRSFMTKQKFNKIEKLEIKPVAETAPLKGIEVGKNYRGLDLEGCGYFNKTFKECRFTGQDFTKARLENCHFIDCDLRWSVITESQSKDNIFENCNTREITIVKDALKEDDNQ